MVLNGAYQLKNEYSKQLNQVVMALLQQEPGKRPDTTTITTSKIFRHKCSQHYDYYTRHHLQTAEPLLATLECQMPHQQFQEKEKTLRVSNLHAHQRKKALSRNCSNNSVSSHRSVGSQKSNCYQLLQVSKESLHKNRVVQKSPSLSKSI